MKFTCAHCWESVPYVTAEIDSGTILTCARCNWQTVVDLFRPEERASLYAAEVEAFRLRAATAVALSGPKIV